MSKKLDPKEFGLPARTFIQQIDEKIIALVIERKSRIIMADGRGILEKVNKIIKKQPSVKVVLKTTAPVCSKTKNFLESESVEVFLINTLE